MTHEERVYIAWLAQKQLREGRYEAARQLVALLADDQKRSPA